MKRTKKQAPPTTDVAHDLLVEPAFRVRRGGMSEVLTLPGVLAALGTKEPISFAELQPHQTHPWHAFLVQLAAIALHRAGEADPKRSEDEWRALLLALTDGKHEPWCLVVPDVSQPAFMQPPIPEGSIDILKREIVTPDDLDVLVTAKNHDVKISRLHNPSVAHWAYALLSLQTAQGFLGAGNYGIARMNGGFGNRPCVSLAPDPSWPARFRRDVAALIASRDAVVDGYGYRAETGVAVTWLAAWDGKKSLALSELDPHFIEICRRIRLQFADRSIRARAGSSKAARITMTNEGGATGDAWTPIHRTDGEVLTLGRSGFRYDRLSELLLAGDWNGGAAQAPQSNDPEEMELRAWALVRGQGKTEGLHERRLRIPKRVRMKLGRAIEREELSQRAKRWVDTAAQARLSVLKPSLCALLQGAPEKLNFKDERPQRWLSRFDKRVDAMFFPALWDSAYATGSEDADQRWVDALEREARAVLNEAIGETPLPTARRYRAIAAAERVFGGAWANKLGTTLHAPEPSQRSG